MVVSRLVLYQAHAMLPCDFLRASNEHGRLVLDILKDHAAFRPLSPGSRSRAIESRSSYHEDSVVQP